MQCICVRSLVLSALLCGPAFADEAASTGAAATTVATLVARLDTNHDGKLDRNEYLVSRRPRFARSDGDADGALSATEFAAGLSGTARGAAATLFATFDVDGSGTLSPAEVESYQATVFTQFLDADKDGYLTAVEIERMAQPSAPSPVASANAALDADGNGAVSASEYVAFQARRFDSFDADGDGDMSLAEFRASLTEREARKARDSFDGFDLNHNRRLTVREFVTYHDFMFKRFIDKNHDDVATAEEFGQVMAQ